MDSLSPPAAFNMVQLFMIILFVVCDFHSFKLFFFSNLFLLMKIYAT